MSLSLFRGRALVERQYLSGLGQFLDHRPDVVPEDSPVAYVSHCPELQQQRDHLDDSVFEIFVIHFESF